MIRALTLPTVRPEGFVTFLRSFAATPAMADWRLYVAVQAWSSEAIEYVTALPEWERVTDATFLPNRQGPWPLIRQLMLSHPDVEVWGAVEDDMEMVPGLTNFNGAAEVALQAGVGIVGCTSMKSLSQVASRHTKQELIPRILMGTGGGHVYSRRVARMLVAQPLVNWKWFDLWVGAQTYAAGFENWRYRGSILVHRQLSPGGTKVLHAATPNLPLPDPTLIELAFNDRGTISATTPTARAHALHRANRQRALALVN